MEMDQIRAQMDRITINIGKKTPGHTLSSEELREIGYVQYLDLFDQDNEWFQKIKNNILNKL